MKFNKSSIPEGIAEIIKIDFNVLELIEKAQKGLPLTYDIEYEGYSHLHTVKVDDYETPDEALEMDECEVSKILDKNGSRLGYDAHVLGCSVMSRIQETVIENLRGCIQDKLKSNRLIILIKSNSYNFSVFGSRVMESNPDAFSALEIIEEYNGDDKHLKNALFLEYDKDTKFNVYERNHLSLDFDLEGKSNFVTAINLSLRSPSEISKNIILCEIC